MTASPWKLAQLAARQSLCDRKQVGAVLVSANGTPVASACNDVPDHPTEHCMQCCARAQGISRKDDYSDCPAVHAEYNLIREFESLVDHGIVIGEWANGGLTAYVTSPPCAACADLLSSKDYISKIVWRRGRKDAHVPDPSPVFEWHGKKYEEIKR